MTFSINNNFIQTIRITEVLDLKHIDKIIKKSFTNEEYFNDLDDKYDQNHIFGIGTNYIKLLDKYYKFYLQRIEGKIWFEGMTSYIRINRYEPKSEDKEYIKSIIADKKFFYLTPTSHSLEEYFKSYCRLEYNFEDAYYREILSSFIYETISFHEEDFILNLIIEQFFDSISIRSRFKKRKMRSKLSRSIGHLRYRHPYFTRNSLQNNFSYGLGRTYNIRLLSSNILENVSFKKIIAIQSIRMAKMNNKIIFLHELFDLWFAVSWAKWGIFRIHKEKKELNKQIDLVVDKNHRMLRQFDIIIDELVECEINSEHEYNLSESVKNILLNLNIRGYEISPSLLNLFNNKKNEKVLDKA